jgi:hypothetical protein
MLLNSLAARTLDGPLASPASAQPRTCHTCPCEAAQCLKGHGVLLTGLGRVPPPAWTTGNNFCAPAHANSQSIVSSPSEYSANAASIPHNHRAGSCSSRTPRTPDRPRPSGTADTAVTVTADADAFSGDPAPLRAATASLAGRSAIHLLLEVDQICAADTATAVVISRTKTRPPLAAGAVSR